MSTSRKRYGELYMRHRNKTNNKMVISNKVKNELMYGESGISHCLIELSMKQFQRMSNNSILLGGIIENISSKTVLYETVTYGTNVLKVRKSCIVNGKKYQWDSFLITQMKFGYLSILCKKEDAIKINPHLLVVDGSNQETTNVGKAASYKPSGYLVLFLMKHQRHDLDTRYSWGKHDSLRLKKCKNNIITTNLDHFGSTGMYFILHYVCIIICIYVLISSQLIILFFRAILFFW